MKRINNKSDFDLLATMKCYDTSGKEIEIGFADYDWELDLYTGCGNYAPKAYKVSYIGGKATNCFNDNGKVHIVCDNHNLNLGVLNGTIRAKIPNVVYPDGTQLIVSPLTFAIELVADGGDTPSPIEVEIMLPYLYDSIYRIAQQGGYKGTQEEYFALASQLPNAVETANKVQESADSLADSAEQIGGSIADLKASVSNIDGAVEDINQGASTIATSATKVETSATTLEGVSATINSSATSLSESATAIAEGANTIKSSADTLQTNADKVSESATKVEQAVEPLVQASESLDTTKQAFEMLSSEWSDGRQAIATALTNRRYPTEPSESFHAMADKITNMSYEEGWFAKIGYTNNAKMAMDALFAPSVSLVQSWEPTGGTSQLFRSQQQLVFAPQVDASSYGDLSYMYNGCSNLVFVPPLNAPNNTTVRGMFYGSTKLVVISLVDIGKATDFYTFLPISTTLTYIKLLNLGKSSVTTYSFADPSNWGTGGEENRQSLIDSLITYSYDRASNGMATATIKLSANTKALLTEEEIAQITNKGFSLA